MDNQRVILFFALSIILLLIWQAWLQDNAPQQPVAPGTESGQVAIGQAAAPAADIPQTPTAESAVVPEATPAVASPQGNVKQGRRIRVTTDLLDVEIDSIGGDIRQADMLAYPVAVDKPDQPLRLMQDQGDPVMFAQSGLLSDSPAPDHHAEFTADRDSYQLADGDDTLRVPLHWSSPKGITVTKIYTFHRDSYVIELEQQVVNASGSAWQGYQYQQLQRSRPGKNDKTAFARTYTGGVIYNEEDKYQKIKFDQMDDEDLSRDFANGWAAIVQHYFLAAWLPDAQQTDHYYTKAGPDRPYVLGMISPQITVAPGATGDFKSRLFVGPKDQRRLSKAAPGLRLTVDYGILTILAQPLYWLMSYIHGVVNNWGWSIIILTLIVKLVFYKLSETSYRSMANMRRLTPKITSIRERYGDDRQRMSQAMMELYKKEKINPLGGCLPMVVQIPVFISLYWVLLESVELRQADFILWIHDLSTKDPYYVLPLLMGITMFIQQKLNPPPPDPVQARVMMALPFIFTAFFAFFPSGLVLYWVANSVLSILQQWVITRRIEKAAAK